MSKFNWADEADEDFPTLAAKATPKKAAKKPSAWSVPEMAPPPKDDDDGWDVRPTERGSDGKMSYSALEKSTRRVPAPPPPQTTVGRIAQDMNAESNWRDSSFKTQPRLNMSHGFLRDIARNQKIRQDYEEQMKQQTDAREQQLKSAQAKQALPFRSLQDLERDQQSHERPSHDRDRPLHYERSERTTDGSERERHYAYRPPPSVQPADDFESWGQLRRQKEEEEEQRRERLAQLRQQRESRPEMQRYVPKKLSAVLPTDEEMEKALARSERQPKPHHQHDSSDTTATTAPPQQQHDDQPAQPAQPAPRPQRPDRQAYVPPKRVAVLPDTAPRRAQESVEATTAPVTTSSTPPASATAPSAVTTTTTTTTATRREAERNDLWENPSKQTSAPGREKRAPRQPQQPKPVADTAESTSQQQQQQPPKEQKPKREKRTKDTQRPPKKQPSAEPKGGDEPSQAGSDAVAAAAVPTTVVAAPASAPPPAAKPVRATRAMYVPRGRRGEDSPSATDATPPTPPMESS
eukprot:TRINITY_DN2632_c0_g1_i1.p1 TRINITY_DN2632_c0_g1~~TRINITY_DN2632_c0_g1_i1.p1  ORF type:complete len:521 (+),score=143.76 TRINITY_DN2632_c0_g1_i1:694-2256(+)